MAKRRKKRTATSSTKRRRSRSRKRTGIAGLPEGKGSTLQNLAKAGLLTVAAIGGGMAGSAIGKPSGVAGLATIGAGTSLLPQKYFPYAIAAGAGMLLAPTKHLPGTVPAAATGVEGIDGFAADAKSRMKAFLSDFVDKTYAGDKIKPVLGLTGLGDVSYNPTLDLSEYERQLRADYALPAASAPETMTNTALMGTENALLGLASSKPENALY